MGSENQHRPFLRPALRTYKCPSPELCSVLAAVSGEHFLLDSARLRIPRKPPLRFVGGGSHQLLSRWREGGECAG